MKKILIVLLVSIIIILGFFRFFSDKNSSTQIIADGCYVGGCSGTICSEDEGAVSTCEFRREYSCYKNARCERQTNGACGWTPTTKLNLCLTAN